MKKLLIGTMCVAAAVQLANAEEFGAATDKAGAAVVAEQEAMESTPSLETSDKSASEELDAYIERQKKKDHDYVVGGKDRKNNRYIVKDCISFTIRSQDVGQKYLELRESMMSLLLLRAKLKMVDLRTGSANAKRRTEDGDETTSHTRDFQRLAALEMIGTTVLEQYESCQKEDDVYKCQIAILMSWSKESENVAKAIQLAFANPSAKPIRLPAGKNTIDGWIAKKKPALGEWLGPRRYVDENGEVWFVGIGAATYEKNQRRNDQRKEEARMKAIAEVGWSLYGDVKMTNALNKTMTILNGKDLDDLTDEEKSSFGRKFASAMEEETTIETAGMIYPFEGEVKDASGQKINVVVAGISVQSKRDALKDLRESEDTAREVKAGRVQERAAREGKIGTPKKVNSGNATLNGGSATSAKPAAEKKGRLGTGVRHFSSDDE